MATIENASIKSLLNYEISRANEVTKKADTTVHNAVGSLIDGYGQNVPNCEVLTEITLDSDVSVVIICTLVVIKALNNFIIIKPQILENLMTKFHLEY